MALYTLTQSASNGIAGVLTFDLSDGTAIRLDTAALSTDIIAAALAHGLKQKVIDAAAIPRNTTTGKSATDEEKIAAMKEVAQRLKDGMWNAPKGEGAQTGGILATALCEITGQSREEMVAHLAAMSAAEKTALRKLPAIAAKISEIEARTGKQVADVSGLLAKLGIAG